MLKSLKINVFNTLIIIAVVGLMIAFSITATSFSSVFYILISGMIGLFTYYLKERLGNK